jgi:hypothetical protein
MSEVYFSLDVETDGPIPFRNSMLQMALAAFTLKDGVIGTLTRKLRSYPGAAPDADCMNTFWYSSPELTARYDSLAVGAGDWMYTMLDCDTWIRSFGALGKPVCCASPAGFDFTFFRCYMIAARGGNETPFKHRCWDARSHAMGILGKEYSSCGKEGIPQSWRPKDLPHTHDALDDALEQAEQFRRQMVAAQAQKQAANAWINMQPALRNLQTAAAQNASYVLVAALDAVPEIVQ